ncbi:MAG: ABC transporter permease [Lachnospira sp.]|nr:ABC transporter permease [Lachnospira sp.]
MGENIRISMRGIWSHKMRSFLTMLGIIIGIAAIIAIISMIQGTNEQIKQNLIGSGTNTVTVQLMKDGFPLAESGSSMSADQIPVLSEETRQQLLAQHGAAEAAFYHARTWVSNVYYKNNSLEGDTVCGIDRNYLAAAGLQVSKGRGFGENDLVKGRRVALVGDVVADSAFGGEDPIGKVLDIAGEPFTVIGVVTPASSYQPVINSESDYYMYMQSGSRTGTIYIPDSMWPVVFQYDEPVSVLLKADSADSMTALGTQAVALLNAQMTGNGSLSWASQDLSQAAAQLQQLAASGSMMLIGIASISLLVGGIGIMNIMLVSVTERTREIGLKKALGAKKRTIRMQFLTEAALLSMIGGALGVIVGIILAQLIAYVARIPVALSVPAIIVSVLFSMAVGILFGLMPSARAANLNPIDTLRYE